MHINIYTTRIGVIVLSCMLLWINAAAQMPVCDQSWPRYVYIDGLVNGNGVLYNWNPSVPLSASNPSLNTISLPSGSGGLAVSNNLNNSLGPSPTFYTCVGGYYHYYNGTAWVNTGHTNSETRAINLGAGGGYIYNLAGNSGRVYRYDGSGNDVLLITVPNYVVNVNGTDEGSGPLDIVADCYGNFYILRCYAPAWLRKYSPGGQLLHQWDVSGAPNVASGGGFGIVGNTLTISNSGGVYTGLINDNTSQINVSAMPGASAFFPTARDFANCVLDNMRAPLIDTLYACSATDELAYPLPGTGSPYTFRIIDGTANVRQDNTHIYIRTSTLSRIEISSPTCNGTYFVKDTLYAIPPLVADAGPDNTITGCGMYRRDTLHGSISGSMPWINYQIAWTPATTVISGHNTLNPVVSPVSDTKYIITVTTPANRGGCVSSDSMLLQIRDTSVLVDLGPDIYGCTGDVILLQSTGGQTGNIYEWSTGTTTPSINVTQSGTYWLRVERNGCENTDTINIMLLAAPVVSLGSDTGICDMDIPYILRNGIAHTGADYLWSNGLSDTTMAVTKTGHYWLELSRHGCVHSDTIYIEVVPTPYVYIGTDSIICEQYPLRIGTEIAGASYSWSTGAATPYIEVNNTDDYILEADLRGCRIRDTISVTAMPAPDVDLGKDSDICSEETIVLDGSAGSNSTYEWSTGETTSSISVNTAGVYTVTVTSEYHCAGSDTIMLSYYPKPTVILGSDTTVCEETPLRIEAKALNADSVIWSDGSAGNTLTVSYGDQYIATGINKCGTNSDTIIVKQIFCDIWLPNAFTPDNDGLNDVFRVLGNLGRLEFFGLSVYNRWGERVFHTEDKHKGWNGLHKGMPVGMGTYVYLLQYSIGDVPYRQQGSFHLLR